MAERYDREYNGWTNWHTWNLMLWIDNTEEVYHKGRVMAGEQTRFKRWASSICTTVNRVHDEGIEWEKVNVEEIREALLAE